MNNNMQETRMYESGDIVIVENVKIVEPNSQNNESVYDDMLLDVFKTVFPYVLCITLFIFGVIAVSHVLDVIFN